MRKFRLHWFDPEPDDHQTPVDWRSAALITATLFLTSSFFLFSGPEFWGFGPLAVDVSVVGVAAVVIAGLFFIGPAMATHAARQPVFESMENSIGVLPTLALRLCSVVFLSLWIANMIAVPILWSARQAFSRDVSSLENGAISAGVLAFVFFTGLQSTRNSARLALFTNKLTIAILIAAFIRVNEGWPEIPLGFPASENYPRIPALWHNLSRLAAYSAPLGFLAADLAYRIPKRKQVMLTVLTGVALPLFLVLSMVGVVGVATHASGFWAPSVQPTVAMALFSKVAGSAMPGRVLVVLITTFGASRFGARALASCGFLLPAGKVRWFLLTCVVAGISALTTHHYDSAFKISLDATATCLTVAGAVMTADFVSGRKRSGGVQQIDGVGVAALLAGLATAFCLSREFAWASDIWCATWLLPSYAVAFLSCLLGRAMQKMSLSRQIAKS